MALLLEDCLLFNGESDLTDERFERGSKIGRNIRDSGAQGLLDVAFLHPIRLIANALGTPGTASRRSFHGPGMLNFDLALLRNFRFKEASQLQFRFEAFNAFNHANFFGPASVQGEILDSNFGYVIKAQPPRLVQIALKLTF